MPYTLLGKPYGLTHEEMLKAHHVLTATAKKTPYQLDLEVKDRKPDIVPKVGDKVKIKSREWYGKWKDEEGNVWFSNAFVPPMADFCGMVLTISGSDGEYFSLKGNSWNWVSEMFEEVYPQESTTISAINPAQGIGIATDWSKLASYTSAIITLPDNRGRVAFTQADIERLRDRWLPKKEPELQTIKKHRFIKLEKL